MNNISHKLAKYNKKMISYTKNGKNVDKIAKKQQKYMNMVGGAIHSSSLQELTYNPRFFQRQDGLNSCGRNALNNFFGGIYFTTTKTMYKNIFDDNREKTDIDIYNKQYKPHDVVDSQIVDVYTDDNIYNMTSRPYNLKKLCVYFKKKHVQMYTQQITDEMRLVSDARLQDCYAYTYEEYCEANLLTHGAKLYGYDICNIHKDIGSKPVLGYLCGTGNHFYSFRRYESGFYKCDSFGTKEYFDGAAFKKHFNTITDEKYQIFFSGSNNLDESDEIHKQLVDCREQSNIFEATQLSIGTLLQHTELPLSSPPEGSPQKHFSTIPELNQEQETHNRITLADEQEPEMNVLENHSPYSHQSQTHSPAWSSASEPPIQQAVSNNSNLCTTEQILQKIRPLKKKLEESRQILQESQDELKTLEHSQSREQNIEHFADIIAYRTKLLKKLNEPWDYKEKYTNIPQTIQNTIDCKIKEPDTIDQEQQFEKKYLKYKSKYLYLKNKASKNI